ncbi:MAG: inorganic phosphate transporter [Bacteroidales bacterium]|nr:inorganic phosphate transporter [Bacteroidales bacterium]MDZ4203543.1 inorganic phosphate transporter [Bacteroidales bacterium]
MLFLIFISSGLFLGWSLGANDAANIFGTAVGSKMLSFRRAALISSIFIIIGAVFQGRGAAETLNNLGAVDALAGAFTVSLCAGLSVLLMTQRGLPVSTSQAVVGAIVGWSAFTGNATDYKVLSTIVVSWISGPVMGMIFSALLFLLMRWFLRKAMIHVIKLDSYIRTGLIIVGAFGAYSLGANNIANVIGVFVDSAPQLELHFGLFTLDGVQLLFLLGSLAIAAGIFTYSKRVMNKVGNGILSLTPEAAIVVVLAHSLVLFLFSFSSLADALKSIGLPALPMVPVSSTQVVIGAVLGIGLVKGAREVKFKALGGIALGWVVTPLVAGIFTYFALFFIQNVFSLKVTSGAQLLRKISTESQTVEQTLHRIDLVMPAILALAALIIVVLIFLFFRQQKLRLKAENDLLVQQNQAYHTQKALSDLEVNAIQKANELLNIKLESKRREFVNIALSITEQREFLERTASTLGEIQKEPDKMQWERKLNELLIMIKQKISYSNVTPEFYGQIEQMHKDFHLKLENAFPDLTDQEKRLAILLRLNLSTKEISTIMNITPKSVEISRYRLRKKLNLPSGENLSNFINNL